MSGAEATAAFGRRLGEAAAPGDVLLLHGPVGAGKTVLAGGVLAGLGVPGPHPSPTFLLVRVYRGRLPAAHADLYRLEGGLDATETGLAEILAGDGVVVVEWAERLGAMAPADALHLTLRRGAEAEIREIACTPGGPGAARLMARVRQAWEGGMP